MNKCSIFGGDPDPYRDTGKTCLGGVHCPSASSFRFIYISHCVIQRKTSLSCESEDQIKMRSKCNDRRWEVRVCCSMMRFRTLTRRLVTIVGVAGGGSLLAVIAFSRRPPHTVRTPFARRFLSCPWRLGPAGITVPWMLDKETKERNRSRMGEPVNPIIFCPWMGKKCISCPLNSRCLNSRAV